MAEAKVQYGRRLMNAVVEERAASGHKQAYAAIPRSARLQDGFREISYSTLANAVNRCAGWLEEQFGTNYEEGEVIAYFGPSDMRYHLLALAAVKTRFVMFFPSPRNTVDALDLLFDDARTTRIIHTRNPSALIQSIIQRRQTMQTAQIVDLEYFLDETPVSRKPFTGTFDEYRFKPWVLLHTSGSTGNPKIVPIKHGLVSAVDAYRLIQHPIRFANKRIFVPFPPFHLAGLNYGLPITLWYDATVVLPPSGAMLTPDLVHNMHLHGNAEHSMLTPSLIAELAKNDDWRAQLSHLEGLVFSGGPLADDVADLVSQLTTLTSSLGATEYGGIPLLPKENGDWQYFKFDVESAGLEFRETDQPGLYELVFVRRASEISQLVQAIFVTFPDVDEYHTKDLFTKHPTKPGLWKYEARLDDVIVLSNGEKLNPVQMEGLITTCPAVKGCLVVGQGKFQTALLVERQDPDAGLAEVSKAIQPFIDRANKLCPTYGRIASDNVILTAPEKPLPRAPKGTIQRSHAVRAYAAEIEASYQNLETAENTQQSRALIKIGAVEETEDSIVRYLNSTLDTGKEANVLAQDDFFSSGIDSLQVISLVRVINKARAEKGQKPVNPNFVYDHPTSEKLALALATGATVKEYNDLDDDSEEDRETWQSMENLYRELLSEKSSSSPGAAKLTRMMRSDEPPPISQPDGGWLAWKQVLGSFLINMCNWGLVNSFGVFQAYYENGPLRSHSPSSIAWIGTVQGTLLLVVGVISGPLFDKGYFRSILVVAGFFLVFALMMLSLATQYYQIMLSQGMLLGICSGLLYIPSIALIPLYFKSRRGLALGLATAGGSIGGIVFPIVFRRLLSSLGFGWATRIIGFISLVCLLGAIILIRPLGSRTSRQLLDKSALTDLPYVSFMVAGFLLFAGVLVPYFLTTTYALEELRLSQDLSFYVLAILNAGQFLGRIIPAILSDWIGPELLLVGAELAAGLLGFAWIAIGNTAGYIVWIVVFGFVSGMIVTLPPAVLPYICPSLAEIGVRIGMLYAVAGIGFLISSPVALALNAASNSFLGSQCWIGACCFAASIFYAVTAFEAWKRRRLYEQNGRHHRPYLFRKSKSSV